MNTPTTPQARVSKITVGRLHNLGNYEHVRYEIAVEFYARMHDSKEPLSAKVELLKTLAKIAGVDASKAEQAAGGRFMVTINMGADQKLTIDKPMVTQKVIEGEVL